MAVNLELQQCLDVLNRNVRAVSDSAARDLISVHDDITQVMLQEVRCARVSLLRAAELEEEEIEQRVNSLRARRRQ